MIIKGRGLLKPTLLLGPRRGRAGASRGLPGRGGAAKGRLGVLPSQDVGRPGWLEGVLSAGGADGPPEMPGEGARERSWCRRSGKSCGSHLPFPGPAAPGAGIAVLPVLLWSKTEQPARLS